jgi:hypothetical protein
LSEFPNLRTNFKQILDRASLEDIEVMIACISLRLEAAHHDASVLCTRAAQELWDYRRGKVPGSTWSAKRHGGTHKYVADPEEFTESDAGGEA